VRRGLPPELALRLGRLVGPPLAGRLDLVDGDRRTTGGGLERLREALDKAGFFSLPPRIDTGDCVTDGTVIRNSGRKVIRRTVVFSAREGDKVATVEGRGDFAAPCTLAELEPVYRALDLEALGDWQNE